MIVMKVSRMSQEDTSASFARRQHCEQTVAGMGVVC